MWPKSVTAQRSRQSEQAGFVARAARGSSNRVSPRAPAVLLVGLALLPVVDARYVVLTALACSFLQGERRQRRTSHTSTTLSDPMKGQ